MNKITAILYKEWLEFKQDRTLVISTLLPPVLLTLMPIGVTYLIGRFPDEDTSELGAVLADPSLAGLSAEALGQAVIGKQFGVLFMMMPLFIPSIIAAYSIVGEKTRRTLEPILATPIRIWELLLAKSLAALIPAILITWLCAAIFTGAIAAVALDQQVFLAIISPGWILLILLCAPLLSLLAVAAAVMVSSRVNDPRTAQQLSAIVIVPILALFLGQLFGLLVLNPSFVLGVAVILALLTTLAIWFAIKVFQREVILTHWK
ncbi:MAG: ABC transporter permease [Chloroflexales bacterium]|nr:ABC transporter permease [Chloroflexales bacterium]